MYIHQTEIQVRYSETDQMGVVHHANYYPWFEVARTEFLEVLGYPYDQIEKEGLMFPLVESYCKYMYPAKYPEKLIIKAWIEEVGAAKVVFCFEILRKTDEKKLAIGKTVHSCIDQDFRLVNLKKNKVELFEKFKEASKGT